MHAAAQAAASSGGPRHDDSAVAIALADGARHRVQVALTRSRGGSKPTRR
jgi:hypothetical protein